MLDEDVVTRLRALHRGEGCTLFTILLAAYATLLHWRTGATDLPIATDMANRLPAGAETLIGMLINQVVLRLDMGAASDLGALLRQARRVVAEAYANQSVPFEELVDELVPRRDPSRPPLAQYKLVLENTGAELHAPLVAENSTGPESPHASEDVPTQLDLTLYAYDLGARIRGLLVYDAELFDNDLAASLAAELREILSEMATAAPVPATGDGR
jgi:non-ribosomal peptide synthetase component F